MNCPKCDRPSTEVKRRLDRGYEAHRCDAGHTWKAWNGQIVVKKWVPIEQANRNS